MNAADSNVTIDHIGIAVTNLDDALKLYAGALGMKETARESVPAEKVVVAMLPAGETAHSPRLELLEASSADSPVARFIQKRGPGIHHLALRVADLDATIRRLEEGGAKLLNEPRAGAGGHTYAFVHPGTTGGVLLELIEDRNRKET